MSIKQYDQVDHPYHLPDQIDVFAWSFPFVADKVVSMLTHVIKKIGESHDSSGGNDAMKVLGKDLATKKKIMLGKVKTMARMQ